MKKKLVLYLATPYSLVNKSKEIGVNKPDRSEEDKKIRAERFKKVNRIAGELYKRGFAVISPISQSHPIALECNIEGKFDFWEDIDYNIIIRCDMIFVYCQNGWKDSDGVFKEINFAMQNNIPVIYIDDELRILEG